VHLFTYMYLACKMITLLVIWYCVTSQKESGNSISCLYSESYTIKGTKEKIHTFLNKYRFYIMVFEYEKLWCIYPYTRTRRSKGERVNLWIPSLFNRFRLRYAHRPKICIVKPPTDCSCSKPSSLNNISPRLSQELIL